MAASQISPRRFDTNAAVLERAPGVLMVGLSTFVLSHFSDSLLQRIPRRTQTHMHLEIKTSVVGVTG